MSTFDADAYAINLERIESIRKHYPTNTELKLPQIVVIGDQSSGKSSVLSELTSVPFPVSGSICTRSPIVVRTKHAPGETVFGIYKNEKATPVDKAELESAIRDHQEATLGGKKVDGEAIRVYARGEGLNDLVLVDLPGIIHSGEGKEEVNAMIRKYIEPEETLIVVVTEAKQDEEGALALALAAEYDPTGERTLRVLTKCDTWDTDASKHRATDLINQGEGVLAPHAVVCRPRGNAYNAESESTELAELGIVTAKAGVKALGLRMPPLLCNRIEVNLPGLLKQVEDALEGYRERLKRVGDHAPDATETMRRVRQKLRSCGGTKEAMDLRMSTHLETLQSSIIMTQDELTEELVTDMHQVNFFRCPFFQGETTFNELVALMCEEWWKPHLDKLLSAVHDELAHNLFPAMDGGAPLHSDLSSALRQSWKATAASVERALHEQVAGVLRKESVYKTMNHYLTSKYEEKLVLPDGVKEAFLKSFTRSVYSENRKEYDSTTKKNVTSKYFKEHDAVTEALGRLLDEAVEEHTLRFNQMPLHKQHVRRVHAAARAYWCVAHKTLLDDVLAVARDEVVETVCAWVEDTVMQDAEIRRHACEHPRVADERRRYKEEITKMEKCVEELLATRKCHE
jgi:GTP-binding protein EngB required for normal cell division